MVSLFSRLFKRPRSGDKASPMTRSLESPEGEVSALIALVDEAASAGPDAQGALRQKLYQCGLRCLTDGYPGAAAAALDAAVRLGCAEDYLFYNLALAQSRSGQPDAAHASFLKAMAEEPRSQEGDGYHLRNLYTLDGVALEELKAQAVAWSRRHLTGVAPFTHGTPKPPRQTLRIGLLSGRFSRHAVGFLTLGALEHLDRARFELVLYDNGSPKDDYHNRFVVIAQAVHDISTLSDEAAANLIHTQNVGVLIDLGGHSAGGRLGVLARKPAPVQVKWAGGQHGTLGLDQVDYFLTDAVETPPDHDRFFVEQPVRLPNSYAVYTPPLDAPPVSALPFEKTGAITFGCFNNLAKISTRTIEAWSSILQSVPNSRLILKHLALSEAITRDRVAALFLAHGIALRQLELRPPTDPIVEHLTDYHDVDVSLDPFPWSGCVTTLESLWMGIPVLTLPGVAFCHRHSASFLTTLGLTDWIAADANDYINKAVSCADKPEDLSLLRASLRQRMTMSPLCDAERFATNLDGILTALGNGVTPAGASRTD